MRRTSTASFWLRRKEIEVAKNATGEVAAQAAESLTRKKYGKDTEAFCHYTAGHLPPAQIHARAKRWGVKLFLAHYHHVSYRNEYGIDPAKPYVIEHLGHAHYIAPPNV